MSVILILSALWAASIIAAGLAVWKAADRRDRGQGPSCPKCGRPWVPHPVEGGLFYSYRRWTCRCGTSRILPL